MVGGSEEKTGGRTCNRSQRQSFQWPYVSDHRIFTGNPIDANTPRRGQVERLYEATQIKGDGETHPYLSPNDEFANFERWDKGNSTLAN